MEEITLQVVEKERPKVTFFGIIVSFSYVNPFMMAIVTSQKRAHKGDAINTHFNCSLVYNYLQWGLHIYLNIFWGNRTISWVLYICCDTWTPRVPVFNNYDAGINTLVQNGVELKISPSILFRGLFPWGFKKMSLFFSYLTASTINCSNLKRHLGCWTTPWSTLESWWVFFVLDFFFFLSASSKYKPCFSVFCTW